MNISQLLHRAALAHGERPAVFCGAELVCDYRTLEDRVARLARHLRERCKVGPGDRVAIFSANCTQYLEALHAIHWAGAISVPVNYKLHSKELAYVLENSGARVVCVSAQLQSAAIEAGAHEDDLLVFGTASWQAWRSAGERLAMQEKNADETASLFYTSGTTGRPKGVMQTHRNLLAATMAYFTDVDDVQAHDAMVYAAPMSHGAGLYNYAHMLRGARHVVPVSGGFDPAELVGLAASIGHLSLFAAPTMVHRLVDHVRQVQADVGGFKTIVYGGGPMYVEDLRRALDTMGQKFVQIYGQGECPMTITALSRAQIADSAHPRWSERIASVGRAHANVEVRVAGANDVAVPTGELGEVVVRGDPVMAGYWGNESATQAALRDGWLHTGDIGSLDADGFLTLRDRSKDVIISGGSNIYPREVEEVLLLHPQISEVAVVGQRDADWGEVVIAFLVARDGARPGDDELHTLCLDHIARFKRPKAYRFVDALPKNSYGKVLKTELRNRLEIQPC
ncbi:AMP-binding protein [Diaphorobacter aerolatus]|uniref:AMP-binding protein n=1 Tax=Diaphorobacter aerolatus TaxID=1288495 RepID=A0A7H0GNN9_9BURK|nr:AMP-binding protein [Diaphorobacter aerolatus]QNP49905.1 AMP-binding protein [Diaphorobacter aerolatus]